MQIQTRVGKHLPRILTSDTGVLKVKGVELYTTELTIGRDVTLEDAEVYIEEADASVMSAYDGDALAEAEHTDALIAQIAEVIEAPVPETDVGWSPDMGILQAGTVVTHGGKRYKVAQLTMASSVYPPGEGTEAIYVLLGDVGTDVREWGTGPTGAHDAYNIGDRTLYLGTVYESLIDANVWAPDVNPSGWKELS